MALDFYSLTDLRAQHLLFSVDDKIFESMEDIWADYKKRSGVFIDPYGDTRIYQDHVQLIISLINKSLADIVEPHSKDLRLNLIEKFSIIEDGLLAIGD